jgi:uncharacterized protein YgbK (DUF1537 family)
MITPLPKPGLSKAAVFAALPPEPTVAPQPPAVKIVVLDDDPTGTQTVHDIPVLTEWSVASLTAELRSPGPGFYLLTNSRAFASDRACAINREIGRNLTTAASAAGCGFRIISRSDSTLRGHYPQETDALTEALGGFDGTLIVPAFFDGGRYTIEDVHYVADGDTLVPAGETEFARDHAFGYRASDLRDWVEEKTTGRVPAGEVVSISLNQLRVRGAAFVASRLRDLPKGAIVIANAAAPGDLHVLANALAQVEAQGRNFLCRSAASLVAARLGLTTRRPLAGEEMAAPGRGRGLIVAGSYVGKTTAQLEALFRLPGLARIEVDVVRLLDPADREAEIIRASAAANQTLAADSNVALYTSRQLAAGRSSSASLTFGEIVSQGLVAIVSGLQTRPRWMIAKGGITSSDLATHALGVRRAMVLGQALPGVPVWRTGPESRWPGLAYIVFPGNVGDPTSLAGLYSRLQ